VYRLSSEDNGAALLLGLMKTADGAALLLGLMKTADGAAQATVGCLKSVGFWPASWAKLQMLTGNSVLGYGSLYRFRGPAA